MIQSANLRKLFSAVLVGFVVVGWIVVNRYTTRALPGTPSSLAFHWLAVSSYLGAIFGAVIVGLLIAFWARIDRTTLLISAWNFVTSAGLLILYFITSDPLAHSGMEQIGLGALRWIFLASGIVCLGTSFVFFGRAVDAERR
jgi:hypothetical protein